MKSEIFYIAEELDETINKGHEIELKAKDRSKQLRKALSHNVMSPVDVGPDSGYYIPYKWSSDGGWLPHDASYWGEKGKDPSGYLTTQKFYDRQKPVAAAFRGFRGFAKSIDSLIQVVPEKKKKKKDYENLHENSEGMTEKKKVKADGY
jgi:hypothetical protein